jgi:molybdopterin-guanine dinucleotide biosynthesis protein A
MTTEPRNGPVAGARPPAVILAGGRSSRFGQDKARARLGNATLLEGLAASLEKVGFRVTVGTGYREHEAFGYPVIWDRAPFSGPLRALGGILEAIDEPRIMLVACDTPFLDPALARWLWEAGKDFDITILEDERGEPSPLPGVYAKSILTALRENLSLGRTSLQSLFETGLRVNRVPAATWREIDAGGRSLVNINTAEDLARARHERRRGRGSGGSG